MMADILAGCYDSAQMRGLTAAILVATAWPLAIVVPQTQERAALVVRRFPAPEANQGVAVDRRFFYAIDNTAIGKYDKNTGLRAARWEDHSGRVTHLDSGVVIGSLLYCAHSNYPQTPMIGSIEIFDVERLEHTKSVPLPRLGSPTWVDQREGAWWVAFAHYSGKGGEPGKGPEATSLVRFDAGWLQNGAWSFPPAVVTKWGAMSSSGGTWTDGGHLYTTGHDAPELYVLDLPSSGRELELREIVRIESHGQGIATERGDRLLYSIQRTTREVLVSRLPPER
jgi:hypothetical protein